MAKKNDHKTNVDSICEGLEQAEGFSSTVYEINGVPHIGFGFNLENFQLTRPISRLILRLIIQDMVIRLSIKYPWFLTMPHVIQYVIVQMVYQMGPKNFSEFKLTIDHFKNRRWKDAADEMLNSRWYRDQTPERAKRLSDMVRGIIVK